MVPLCSLNIGDHGEIAEILGHGSRNDGGRGGRHGHRHGHCHGRVAELGLRVGKTIELLQKGNQGPLLVKVDESRIAIGRGIAERIIVKNQP
ncbi:MAG: ferrous iron transport protein A [Proteobacteria bacterium]|nr:ferrous iron transport protein A [Pseudomonadota bacterium]